MAQAVVPAAEPTRPQVWSGSAQANGSLLFGNTDQRVASTTLALARTDSTFELSASAQGLYGDASFDDGQRQVTRRLALGTLAADWRPYARLSPFILATVERNLEKRLRGRYNVGLGGKLTILDSPASEVSVSVALLDERIDPQDGDQPTTRLTRWSNRLRLRRQLNDRVRVSNVTFWRPALISINRYVVQSTSELAIDVTRRTAFTVSFFNLYDSEAVSRGAQAYNDGQLLFGVSANW